MESTARVALWVLVMSWHSTVRSAPVGPMLAAAVAARRAGVECLVVPEANLQEAALVPDLRSSRYQSRTAAVRRSGDHLDPASGPASGDFRTMHRRRVADRRAGGRGSAPDLADVRGQCARPSGSDRPRGVGRASPLDDRLSPAWAIHTLFGYPVCVSRANRNRAPLTIRTKPGTVTSRRPR